MDMKKVIIIAAVCLVALALICVVVVGLINGVWPWTKNITFGEYFGFVPRETTPIVETGEPTETTDDTTADAQDTTADAQGATNGTDGTTGTTGTTGATESSTATTGPADSTKPSTEDSTTPSTAPGQDPAKPTIGVEIEDGTTPEGSTTPGSAGDKTVIDFQELLDKANGK